MSLREPVLHATPILSLRPTQMTLGMKEVGQKRDAWRTKAAGDLAKFLSSHMVPTIVGPEGEHFLIDHHHLARALHEEGVKSVFVTVVADLNRLEADHFWNMMDFRGWTHPYDAKGRRRPYSDLPKTVKSMEDDPYRSLAGELRNIGGFAKDFDPLRRIPVGRLPASAHQGQGDQGGFRRRAEGGADLVQERRSRLPSQAGAVRTATPRPRRGRGRPRATRRPAAESLFQKKFLFLRRLLRSAKGLEGCQETSNRAPSNVLRGRFAAPQDEGAGFWVRL